MRSAGGASSPPPTSTIPQRLSFDKELLRRFYLKHGYVDFRVVDAKAELSPDRKSFFLTFTLHEGPRYRIGKITINSHLRHLVGNDLRDDLQLEPGDWFDGDAIARTVDKMEQNVHDPRLRLRAGQAGYQEERRQAYRRPDL